MNILVVGASGFLGKKIFDYGLSCGHNILGTYNSNAIDRMVRFDMGSDNLANLLPDEFLVHPKNSVIILCSSITNLDFCKKDKDYSHKINVLGVKNILKLASMTGIKVLFFSTDNVFNGISGNYTEDSMVSPVNIYGEQKAEIEKDIVNNYPSFLVFRISKIISDKAEGNHFLNLFYQNTLKEIKIKCAKGSKFSPTYIDDIAKAVYLALKLNLSGIYNVCNDEAILISDLARKFLKTLNMNNQILDIDLNEFNFFENRALNTTMMPTKFIKATDFKFTKIEDMLLKFKYNLR